MSRVGTVTKVTVSEEHRRVFVNVSLSPTEHATQIRYRTPGAGVWFVPEEGDIVEVETVGRNRQVAFAPHNVPEEEEAFPTELTEGDIAFQLDKDTLFHFSKQEDDETYDVTLKTAGDILLEGATVTTNQTG